MPVSTFNLDMLDAVDNDIPGFGSKDALDLYTQHKGRKSMTLEFKPCECLESLLTSSFHAVPQSTYNVTPTDMPLRPAAVVLLHAGRQVAMREQLNAMLAACHAEAGQDGRGKTG